MVRLLRRKQNSSILRTYGISPSPLIFNLARSINLAGAVEAVGVSHTDSGEGMMKRQPKNGKSYLSLGERPASGGFKAEPYPFNASRSRQMSRSDREGFINIYNTLSCLSWICSGSNLSLILHTQVLVPVLAIRTNNLQLCRPSANPLSGILSLGEVVQFPCCNERRCVC